MADVTFWENKKLLAEFQARSKTQLAELLPKLAGQTGVIVLEPDSGDYFIGATLGKANAAAAEKYRDRWLYYARFDDIEASMAMVCW